VKPISEALFVWLVDAGFVGDLAGVKVIVRGGGVLETRARGKGQG